MPESTATKQCYEIAKAIGRHPWTVLRWHRNGEIRGYVKNPRLILFDLDEVLADMKKRNLKAGKISA